MSLDTPFVNGAEKLRKRIERIRETAQLPAMVAEMGALLHRRTLTRFDREVDPDEKPWAPLKQATVVEKRRRGFGGRGKLKRTLNLRNSIKLIRGGAGTTFTNTGAGVRIGVEDPNIVDYARAHNRGTATIPARRFLGIGRLDIKAIDSLLRRKAKQLGDVR